MPVLFGAATPPPLPPPPPPLPLPPPPMQLVNLHKLDTISLKRYRRVFQLSEVDAAAQKEALLLAVQRHFTTQASGAGAAVQGLVDASRHVCQAWKYHIWGQLAVVPCCRAGYLYCVRHTTIAYHGLNCRYMSRVQFTLSAKSIGVNEQYDVRFLIPSRVLLMFLSLCAGGGGVSCADRLCGNHTPPLQAPARHAAGLPSPRPGWRSIRAAPAAAAAVQHAAAGVPVPVKELGLVVPAAAVCGGCLFAAYVDCPRLVVPRMAAVCVSQALLDWPRVGGARRIRLTRLQCA